MLFTSWNAGINRREFVTETKKTFSGCYEVIFLNHILFEWYNAIFI